MKYKIYFLILFTVIINKTVFPQFTITSSYIPVIGDTLKTSEADTTGLTPGEAGENKTWNFSNITILSGTPWEEVYLQPLSTPYGNQFPNANIASINNNTNPDYHYYQNTSSDWNMIGFAVTNFTKWFTIPYCRFHYPMSYCSQYNSTYKAYSNSGQATTHTTGFKTLTVDGYGTIILPGVTFNNVMRVKSTDESFDTIKVGGNVVSTNHTIITNYQWYKNGYKFPVFDYGHAESVSMYSFKFASISIKNAPVFINQISETVPDKFELYQNYPNPFNPTTTIQFQVSSSKFIKLIVFDILGKEVTALVNEKLAPGTYEIIFDGSNLPSGVYFCKLVYDNFISSKRMILIN
ncbi:MAG: T9SS type A sorting domain-containing protein [Ignavibacteria bacterium]|nr:T9SS type A sorting domain-containing protein [Ignavibacteria bacterium]